MSKVGVHLIVEGRVQGVGFRYFCQNRASKYMLSGTVKNLPDGNVEIEAEGDENHIQKFLNSLHNDHPYANVQNINTTYLNYTGNYKDFKIIY